MSDVQLVVASDTDAVLSTGTPLLTDGLAEWFACSWCGARGARGDGGGRLHVCLDAPTQSDSPVPDGVFPVTVARRDEVRWCPFCEGFGHVNGDHYPPWNEVGAIVEVGQVTGPSHNADECHEPDRDAPHYSTPRCTKRFGADYLGWHTPYQLLYTLDVPIPCDRPTAIATDRSALPFVPADWWTPDASLTAALTGEDARSFTRGDATVSEETT